MRTLAGLGVVLVLVAVGYMDRAHKVGLGDVAHCLKGNGASVESSQAGPWERLRGSDEGGAYSVDLHGDRGTLLRIGGGVSSKQLQDALDAEGARVTAQSSGRILVLWQGRPAARSAAALNRCLH
jgi:hypothetical protein